MTAWSEPLSGWFRRIMEAGQHDTGETASITGAGGSENEPVVVWHAANPMEAQVVKGRLESEGIPAYVRSEALGAIYGLTAGGLARADVLVPGLLAEKALQILFPDGEGAEPSDDAASGSGEETAP